MLKKGDGSLGVLCALLSMWICVIIFSISSQSAARETMADADARAVMVIDPGHGGRDGGAVSVTGTVESAINWSICRRLNDLARFMGIPTVMTRQNEEIDYPPELNTIAACKKWDTRQRVALANETENGVLVSIHQNFYPSAQPRGAQVLYAATDGSQPLAEEIQNSLKILMPDNRRTAGPAPKNNYIMSHVQRPAVLIECGFISHRQEAVLLEDGDYQKKLAAVAVAAFSRYTGDESH